MKISIIRKLGMLIVSCEHATTEQRLCNDCAAKIEQLLNKMILDNIEMLEDD